MKPTSTTQTVPLCASILLLVLLVVTLWAGKLGRDAIHPATNVEKVKPKNYTGKTTNGSGCFNDYTRARYNKDTAVNLHIIHGLFVGGILQYVRIYC